MNQSTLELTTWSRRKAREKAYKQVAIAFLIACESGKWRKISKPITKRSSAKPKQIRITFDTVKSNLMAYYLSVRLLQVRAGAEPRNLAVGDPEVVEVGPAMFSIPQVRLTMV